MFCKMIKKKKEKKLTFRTCKMSLNLIFFSVHIFINKRFYIVISWLITQSKCREFNFVTELDRKEKITLFYLVLNLIWTLLIFTLLTCRKLDKSGVLMIEKYKMSSFSFIFYNIQLTLFSLKTSLSIECHLKVGLGMFQLFLAIPLTVCSNR